MKVRGMVSKHIGRSQTDLMRIFEDIKTELTLLSEEVKDQDNSNKGLNVESIVSGLLLPHRVGFTNSPKWSLTSDASTWS